MTTIFVCSRCGATTEPDAAGWLIAPRKGAKPGHLIIRCPEHVTKYALAAAGIRSGKGGRPEKQNTRGADG